MPEAVEWLADGTASGSPFSPRFGDRYRSELGGLEQSTEVFLKGCGLPAAWANQPQWSVLETGFGLGLNFLVTWQAWKADPQRPRTLHFVSTEAFPASAADVLRSALPHPMLLPFAEQLQARLWGLLPGFHRLAFEGGQVLLTLCIGDAKAMLREQSFEADSVYLDGFSPGVNPDIWDVHTFKAVAQCCRRGTRIATWTVARSVRDALAQAGFVVQKVAGTPPKRDNLQGEYQPAWEPRRSRAMPARRPAGRCIVIGSGLSGAAAAASLARRGWQVTVLDVGATPAAGASGLPAGVLAPHVSPDDSLLSRLSRHGVRTTFEDASRRLIDGLDWAPSGVLEHSVARHRRLPAFWQQADTLDSARDWTCPPSAAQLQSCGLPAGTAAHWHPRAGWIEPAKLVASWLATPGVRWKGECTVKSLRKQGGDWQALDADEQVLGSAELVVIAAAHGSLSLASCADTHGQPLHQAMLTPIRGQVSMAAHHPETRLPPFPVNGHGSFIPSVPWGEAGASAASAAPAARGWIMGASFDRGRTDADVDAQDHAGNWQKMQALVPDLSRQVADRFESAPADTGLQAWAGVRCASPTRLPVLGPLAVDVEQAATQGLWICSGMGSRGLTFAALCGEILAARMHAEPLPVERQLADAMLPGAMSGHPSRRKPPKPEPGATQAPQ